MRPVRNAILQCALITSLPFGLQAAEPAVKPAPPAATIPALDTVRHVILCGDCDQPFSGSIHKKLLEQLVSNEFIGELRKALYLQDTVLQFESKAHFDNCDFGSAITYIEELLGEVDRHVQTADKAGKEGKEADRSGALKKAFFALGQALHGVQDFYSHTDYVERSVKAAKKSTDIPVLAPWEQKGKTAILQRYAQGELVSGHVFWGFPQQCPAGTISHADLAKDGPDSKSGKLKIPHLDNRSQHQIAVQLAREASQQLIDYAFSRWPGLKEANGKLVAIEVMVDRRGL